MLELSAELSALLCDQYDIPPERAQFKSQTDPTVVKRGFTGHVDVPGHGSHTDPGSVFPWDWYLGRVKFYLDQTAQAASDSAADQQSGSPKS